MIINPEHGVLGTDNHAPIYDPNSLWKIWEYAQIYRGQEGKNKYVPKPRDLVFNIDTGEIWIVVEIDFVTMVARLTPWRVSSSLDPTEQDDFYLGAQPNRHAETYRLFIDKSVIPYEAVVDRRNMIGASSAKYAKVYRGSASVGDQEVISMVYDASGNFLGNEVPLELVATANRENISVYTAQGFKTTFDLPDNEPVTIRYYDDESHVISQRLLIVQNTGFVKSGATDTKYIVDIELETPYLSKTEPRQIDFPINLTLDSAGLIGVVKYSDGSKERFPATGPHFDLLGIDDFISSMINQKLTIHLRYRLRKDEVSYRTVSTTDPVIMEPYTVFVTQAKNIYSVKLFCFPVWVDAVNGYRLGWFLYNLERKTWERVDTLIEYNLETNPAFNPTGYGLNQRISVTIDLARVSSLYRTYRHTQVFDVVLIKQGTETPTLWRVNDYGSEHIYGVDLQAKYEFINQNLKKLRVDSGCRTLEEWLNRLYYDTNPLWDRQTETKAPEPNYFVIATGHDKVGLEFPISDWDRIFDFAGPITADDTLWIRFLRRTPDNDLQLSVAGLPIKQVTKITV